MVARGEARHALAHRLDHAGALVPEHRGRVTRRIGATGRVHIGVADAAGGQANEHLARPRTVELNVLNHERLRRTPRERRHGSSWRRTLSAGTALCHAAALSRHHVPSTHQLMADETNKRGDIGPQCSSRPVDAAIAALARRQHGVVARGQLLELGLGGYGIRHRLRTGRLHVLHRGVYAVGHQGVTAAGMDMAAVLACGRRRGAQPPAAASRWGLRPSARARIDVTTPRECAAMRESRCLSVGFQRTSAP